MLHHAQEIDQEPLLLEMARVADSKIIISENLAVHSVDRLLQQFHEIEAKTDFQSAKLSFKSQDEWIQNFEKVNLRLLDLISIPRSAAWWYPIPRCYFVLGT